MPRSNASKQQQRSDTVFRKRVMIRASFSEEAGRELRYESITLLHLRAKNQVPRTNSPKCSKAIVAATVSAGIGKAEITPPIGTPYRQINQIKYIPGIYR